MNNKPYHMYCPHCHKDWTTDFHVEEHGAVLTTMVHLYTYNKGTVVRDVYFDKPDKIDDSSNQYYFELYCDHCNSPIDSFGSNSAFINWVNEKEEEDN